MTRPLKAHFVWLPEGGSALGQGGGCGVPPRANRSPTGLGRSPTLTPAETARLCYAFES